MLDFCLKADRRMNLNTGSVISVTIPYLAQHKIHWVSPSCRVLTWLALLTQFYMLPQRDVNRHSPLSLAPYSSAIKSSTSS